MSESQSENAPQPQDGENKTQTPSKRTPSKRRSIFEKAQLESEELIKNMGGSLDVEGGRKTRSSTRGSAPSTPVTPPPAKKPRTPASSRRGRQKKVELENEEEEKLSGENTASPNKIEKDALNEKQLTKLENCENDVDKTHEKTSTAGKSEVDAKINNFEKEKLESISEESQSQDKDSKQQQEIPTSTVTKVEKEKSEVKANKSQQDSTKKLSEITPQSAIKEDEHQKLDKVEPMEVDGPSVEGKSSSNLLICTPIAKTVVPSKTDNSKKQSSESAKVNDSSEESKNQLSDKPAEETITSKNDVIVKKDDKESRTTATVNAQNENSITEKSAEYLQSETKTEESNKSGSDVFEPKISTPSNSGEVVTAQPCN